MKSVRHSGVLTWALRLVVGGAFVVSGFAKAIDPWGTLLLMEELLGVWDITQPRTLTVTAAILLSAFEFVCGTLLALGCYRRAMPALLLAMMAVMTPYTLYLWIADPVAHCGCFGDMIVLSNAATFWKNVVLVALLVVLLRCNRGVSGAYTRHMQWVVGAILTLYIWAISVYGYNVQPMLDFRRFAMGTSLLPAEEDEDVEYAFVYERDGEQREFGVEALPDSTWTFVERRVVSGSEEAEDTGLHIVDDDGEAITAEGEGVLFVIADLPRVNPGQTYLLNELSARLRQRGVQPVALLAPSDEEELRRYEDIAMVQYPVYRAEATVLRELVRGYIGVVTTEDGVVRGKTTLDFYNPDRAAEPDEHRRRLLLWSGAMLALLLLLRGVDYTLYAVRRRVSRRAKSAG